MVLRQIPDVFSPSSIRSEYAIFNGSIAALIKSKDCADKNIKAFGQREKH